MKLKFRIILIILPLLFLVSCGSNGAQILKGTSSPSHTQTFQSTFTFSPTKTSQPITPTLTPNPLGCISFNIAEGKPPFEGTILSIPFVAPPYLVDLQSGQRIEFWKGSNRFEFGAVTISPNHRLIAYLASDPQATTDRTINIVNAKGEEQKQIKFEEGWDGFDWLDDQRLLIRFTENPGSSESIMSVDIQTAQRKILPTDFPSRSDKAQLYWGSVSRLGVLYNSSLTLAFYTGENSGKTANLYDLFNNKVIASNPIIDFGDKPIWSPDGKRLILSLETNPDQEPNHKVQQELYEFSDDGQFVQLTHLSEDKSKDTLIFSPQWSPDGQYVSFLISHINQENQTKIDMHLAILDIATGQSTEYCNPDQFMTTSNTWSSVSRYLFLAMQDGTLIGLILDLQTNIATRIGDPFPAGWVK